MAADDMTPLLRAMTDWPEAFLTFRLLPILIHRPEQADPLITALTRGDKVQAAQILALLSLFAQRRSQAEAPGGAELHHIDDISPT